MHGKNNKKRIEIMIVEDENLVLRSYAKMLEKSGFSIRTATTGAEALRMMDKSHPDLLILDILIPQIDGFEVLRRMKRDGLLKKFPILIVSNLDKKHDVEHGMRLGATDYLVKSDVSLQDLHEKVKEILGVEDEHN